MLLDEKLRAMDARAESIDGYDSHYAVGGTAMRHVANGLADVTVGTEREAFGIKGVQFVPMQEEWVDLVVRKTPESRSIIKRLKGLMAGDRLRQDFAKLQASDSSKLGVIVYES